MDVLKKLSEIQKLSSRPLARRLAILSLILVVFTPANSFQSGGGQWLELISHLHWEKPHEILNIYSIVRSYRKDLSEPAAWAIAETILEESKKHSLDPLLVLAVIKIESHFRDAAVSTRGARGLMQIRPFVGNALAQTINLKDWDNERSLEDPILNIRLGVLYLSHLKERFRDVKLALTAYNWGPTELKNRIDGEQEVPLGYAMKVLSTYHRLSKASYRTNE